MILWYVLVRIRSDASQRMEGLHLRQTYAGFPVAQFSHVFSVFNKIKSWRSPKAQWIWGYFCNQVKHHETHQESSETSCLVGQGHPSEKLWVRQLGWLEIPNIHRKMPNSWQPNHQPVLKRHFGPQLRWWVHWSVLPEGHDGRHHDGLHAPSSFLATSMAGI